MSVSAMDLLVKVQAEGVKQTEDALKGVSKEGATSKGHLGGLLTTIGGFVGGAAIVNLAGDAFNFLKGQVIDSFHAGMDANAVMAQTVAGLRSTHDASGMTAQSVADLASHISDMSGIQDDAVQTSENMLLTFENIGKNVFPQATQAAADLATKMAGGLIPNAQQMQQASLQLGKALGDPTKGYAQLQRVGVTFSAQQIAMIKHMQKAGDIAGAQKVILGELNKEFGGSAAAAGAANGGLAILQARFENMKESLGQQLIPVMVRLLTALQPITNALMDGLGGAIASITPFLDGLGKTFSALPLGNLGNNLNLIRADFDLWQHVLAADALPVLKQLGAFFTGVLVPAFVQFTGFAAGTLIPMFGQIADFILTTVAPAIIQLASFIVGNVLPAAEQLVTWFSEHVLPVLMTLVSVVVQNVLPVLESLAQTIITRVVPPVERIIGIILPVLIPAFHALGWVVQNVVGPALNILLTIIGFLLNKLADFVQWLEGAVPQALSALGNLASKIGGFFSNLKQQAVTWGEDMIKNLASGITNAIGNVTSAVGNVAANIKSFLHFTKPDTGPLADVDTWMPDFGALLSKGLTDQTRSVGAAARQVASSLAGGLGNLSGVGGGGITPALIGGGVGAAGARTNAGAGAGGAGGQPIVLTLDGRVVARGLLPYTHEAIRLATGIRWQ